MATFYEVATRIIQTYRTLLLTVFLAIVFSLAAYFLFTRYYSNYAKNKEYGDVANLDSQSGGLQIFFFYADWCPHCQTAKPDWKQFVDQNNGQTINNYLITATTVDCSDLSENPDTAEMVKLYKVKGYPTVFAIKNGKRIDYDAKVQLASLNQYVQAITK